MSTQFSFRSSIQTIIFLAISTFQTNLEERKILLMNPYAKPNERKTGAQRPKISHLPGKIDNRTRSERRAEKQAVAAERRAIKKSARQDLKRKLLDELGEEST
jgi:hypothetical protein